MRWLLWLLLLPFVALAQPDPSPLAPGTFDLTITEADGAERLVEGWAAVHAYPAALGGWTLVLDDGEDLVAIERATAPDLDGAAFADARDVVEDDAARAYLRLGDLSVGAYSSGAQSPRSRNRLTITETDDDHTLGAFDFAAVRVEADATETSIRVVGRFHAITDPDGPGGGEGDGDGGFPPIVTSGDCPDIWDTLGGIHGGLGSWTGFANETNVGGPVFFVNGAMMGAPGWQLQLTNGCNLNYPGTYTMTVGHTATPLRAGIYRILDAFSETPPGPGEVLSGLSAPYDRSYVYTSGYVWISSISDGRVRGTYSGYATPIPDPTRPPTPTLFSYGRFSARDTSPAGITLPPGVDLPPGTRLPPGIRTGQND